jgi:MFS family permease
MSDIVRRGLKFFRKQQTAYKSNMARLLVSNFSASLTQQYQPIYITELGATPMELGYVSSLGGVASSLATVPMGWLADRYGIKKTLISGLIIAAIGYALFGAANQWQTTALGLMIATMAWQGLQTVCPMICGHTLAGNERATGMQLCDTVVAFPRFIAPVVGAFIITRFGGISVQGIRPLFWLEAGGLLLAALVVYLLFSNPVRLDAGEPPKLLEGLGRVLREGKMAKRWIVMSMFGALPVYMAIYIPLYARDLKGASQYTLGLMDSAYWLLIFLTAIPMGLAADKYGKKKIIFLLTPLYILSLILLMYAPSDLFLVASGLLSGTLWLALVTQVSVWGDLVPLELLGSWSGLLGLARGLVGILSPVLGGFLWNTLGPDSLIYFMMVAIVARALLLATIPSSITRG